jgi:predicted alpha-1,6-mannanase (GH76 family)
MVTEHGVLEEPEVIRNEDGVLFKGIFMRNLGRFAEVLDTEPAIQASFRQFIGNNIRSIEVKAATVDYAFGGLWEGPIDPKAAPCTDPSGGVCGNATGATPQISGLLLLVSI